MAEGNKSTDQSTKESLSGDFSVLQVTAASPESILKNSSWPKQDDISFTEQRPSFSEDNLDSSQIFASHYALSTAYSRVKKKLAEAESRNKQMQESLRSQENFESSKMTGSSNSQANYALLPNIEASVNQAWEAYNEKCKECQQLREELEQANKQSDNSAHFSRIQNLQEDVLREKAKQDDFVRKLEKKKIEADHLGKKEILAREELEKEREYQRSLIQSAEKKHNEMETRISELESSLANEKNLTSDLRKREKDRYKAIEDEFITKKEVFVARVREVEEENIRLREEVTVLLSMRQSPSNPHRNMNGFPESLPNHIDLPEQENNKEAQSLCTDVDILRGELNELKTRAAEQNHILEELFQHPKIITLFQTSDIMQGTAIQCSEELLHKRKKTNSTKASLPFAHLVKENGERHVIGSSLPSQNHNGSTTTNSNQFMNHRQPISNTFHKANPPSATIILKPTEEFIQSLSGETEAHKMARSPMKDYVPLFPPVGVSRVIHNPNSIQTTSYQQRNSQKFSDDFDPMTNNLQQTNQTNPPASATYTSFINGNIPTTSQVLSNGPSTAHGQQDSMSIIDSGIQSNLYHTARMIPSDINENAILLPPSQKLPNAKSTNPFYKDTGGNGTGQTLLDYSLNHEGSSTTQSISNMRRGAALTARLSISTSATPPGRIGLDTNHELISSDEDNTNTNQLLQMQSNARQPKEFVVPKVVHASSLLVQEDVGRKAFQDSRHSSVPANNVTTRPSIRAKTEVPTGITQSKTKNTRPEIGDFANQHIYPASGQNNRNEEGTSTIRTCPICLLKFGPEDWTEQRMNRHINNHFSDDEDNDMLSFD